MKKIVELLRRFDHIWGFPLAVLILIGCNLLSVKYFNDPLISTEYLTPIFLTACIFTALHAICMGGMLLNHKDLLKSYIDESWREKLPAHYQVFAYLAVYAFYFITALIVYFSCEEMLFVR